MDEHVGYGAVEHIEVGGRLEATSGEDHERHGEVPSDPQQGRHAQHNQDEFGGVGVLDEPFMVIGVGGGHVAEERVLVVEMVVVGVTDALKVVLVVHVRRWVVSIEVGGEVVGVV